MNSSVTCFNTLHLRFNRPKTSVSTMLIMLEPFLLVRLVDHFRPVARRIQIFNLIGLGISLILLAAVSPQRFGDL